MDQRAFELLSPAFRAGLAALFWSAVQAAAVQAQEVCLEEIAGTCMRWGVLPQPRTPPTAYSQGVSQSDADDVSNATMREQLDNAIMRSQGVSQGEVADVANAIRRKFRPPIVGSSQKGAKVTLSILVSSDGRILGSPKVIAPQGPLDATHRALQRSGIAALIDTDEQSGFLPVAGREVRMTFTLDGLGLKDAR